MTSKEIAEATAKFLETKEITVIPPGTRMSDDGDKPEWAVQRQAAREAKKKAN